MKVKTRKIVLTALFIAIGYIGGSLIVVPLGFVRAAPFQHFMNILVSFLLGPWYSVVQAFGVSFLRNVTGTGSLLAFPGSMIGALLSGIFYKYFKKFYWLFIGEVIGTGVIGALLSYPIARVVMNQEAALFGFVPAFFMSALVGAMGAMVLVYQLKSRKEVFTKINTKNI
jgi:energy coupling factor transporter S component ThiW